MTTQIKPIIHPKLILLRRAASFALLGAVVTGALFGHTVHGESIQVAGALGTLSLAKILHFV